MKPSDKIIGEVVEAIAREATPEQIILFGSHAKGDATDESDIDLLVVESGEFGPEKSRRKELARLSKAVARFQFPIDILLYSKTEVERWKHSLNNVVAHAFREGKVVYERH
ncbi:MAG: nucleotidyltransferase domain-containing protein [Nitrospinae bacterium]|nr:nucleotidyltransferase domain-containing protein [Nitrospinota bacterium]MBF0633808.1 nucleotidyltransferase domain-containing protein [Nitrospinota bacterium]